MEIVRKMKNGSQLIEDHELNFHIEEVSEMTEQEAIESICDDDGQRYFKTPLSGDIYLNYPLHVVVKLTVSEVTTFGSLLWKVAQAYKHIYDQEEMEMIKSNQTTGIYGIWGHELSDLWFEFVLTFNNNVIDIGIGS